MMAERIGSAAPTGVGLGNLLADRGVGQGDSTAVNMGIAGFEPSFLVGIDAIRRAHESRLEVLPGRLLSGFALVRFAEDGDWFADCPVVLDFDGIQLEVCHTQLDELSIGWNTIDTAVMIGGWDWFELTPEWSRSDERLAPFLGQTLREVALLEWRPSSPDLAAGTVAVEFVFDAGLFRIANGLDENRIEVGVAQPEYLRHRLGR
jgi:hypothetical protein